MSRAGIDRVFERRLSALVNAGEPQILQGGRKGVEKESLRVQPEGTLAHTPHPPLLGSALTNEHITTDYSEALIELVTPAFTHSWELLQYLLDLHQFVYRHLGEHRQIPAQAVERMAESRRRIALEEEVSDPGWQVTGHRHRQEQRPEPASQSRGRDRNRQQRSHHVQPARGAVAVLPKVKRIELAKAREARGRLPWPGGSCHARHGAQERGFLLRAALLTAAFRRS